MAKLKLTVACGDYEDTRALSDGSVGADGIELVMLTDMGSREHMARESEFDVCEINIGSSHGARPRTDSPQSRYSCIRASASGFVFVNVNSGIRTPKDLIARAAPSARLQHLDARHAEEHYGVPHRQCTWVVEREEDVVFTAPKGSIRIEMVAPGKRLDLMLAEGEIPARCSRPTFRRCSARATSA